MLDGALVLEIGGGIAASYAGMLLRAAGATVVRLESASDSWRVADRWTDKREQAYVMALDGWLNVGKHSVAWPTLVDVAGEAADLAARADVVIDDVDSPARRAAGLQVPERLSSPWITVTPFGVDHAGAGSDLTAAAMSGAVWAIGRPDQPPLTMPHAQTAVQGGVIAAMLAAAAVTDDGPPRHLDVAWAEVVSSYAATNATLFVWEREGHRAARSGGAYPYTILPCRDGSVCLAARSNAEWRRILDALDNPAWSDDPRYANVRRIAEECPDEVDHLLAQTLARFDREELLSRAIAHGCTIAPVRTFADLVRDEDLRVAGAVADDASGANLPWLSWFGNRRPERPPALGEAPADICTRLGVDAATVA